MIVVVADETELEGAEQIVGAAIRDWASDAGGVAVFRCHVPESRGGSVEVDALVCTPQGATVVEVKGFTARQDGTLATPPNGPWTIDDEPAALYHAVRVPNPFVQVRRQVFAAKNLLQQSGIFGWVNAVIALVPQPGSDITIEETRIADGYRAVLVGRDDSSALHDYFNAETGRTVRLSVADVSRVFAGLNLRHLLPAPHELAAQGFPAELDPATTSRPAAPPAVELATAAGSTTDTTDSPGAAEVATSGSARMTTRLAQATTPAFLAAIDRLAHRPHSSSRTGGPSGASDERESSSTRVESASDVHRGPTEDAPRPAEPTSERETDSSADVPSSTGSDGSLFAETAVVETAPPAEITSAPDQSASAATPPGEHAAIGSRSPVGTAGPAASASEKMSTSDETQDVLSGAEPSDSIVGPTPADDGSTAENNTGTASFDEAPTSGATPGEGTENDMPGSEDAMNDPEHRSAADADAADTASPSDTGAAAVAPSDLGAGTSATSASGGTSAGEPEVDAASPSDAADPASPRLETPSGGEIGTGAETVSGGESLDAPSGDVGSGAVLVSRSEAGDGQVADAPAGGAEDSTSARSVVSLRKNLPGSVVSGSESTAVPADAGPGERGRGTPAAGSGAPQRDPGVVFEAGSGWRSGVASYRTERADDDVAEEQRGSKSSGSAGVRAALGGAAVVAAAGAATRAAGASGRSDRESEDQRAVVREGHQEPHEAEETTRESRRDQRESFGATQESPRDARESYGNPQDPNARPRESYQDPYASPHESYQTPPDPYENQQAAHQNPQDPYANPQGAYQNPQDPYGNTEHWTDWVERDRRAQRPTFASRVRERLRGGDGPSLLERWRNRPVRDRGERTRRLRVGPGLGLVLFIVLFGAGLFAITAVQASRFEMSDYDRMCGERKPFPNAAAYESGGPRPIYLSGSLAEMVISDSAGAWHPRDTSSVQLIACMTQLDLRDIVQTCQYAPAPGSPIGRTVNLFRAGYEIVVYEAHSGREVARANMVGERYSIDPSNTDPDRCRAAADAPDYLGRRLGQPSAAQVTGFLAPLVGTDR
ncbi:NERD domain-containing protein [Nocardia sp. NPDC058176]|uniref:NERD domain-containing protein n=1 Tax=Nocardia sp. NPDC058176 TaxID=3346368 RepID=UPI0036DA0B28